MMNEWIDWNGGECPVERGTLVDVKYRDGYVEGYIEALNGGYEGGKRTATNWEHYGKNSSYEIIAYRLSEVRK